METYVIPGVLFGAAAIAGVAGVLAIVSQGVGYETDDGPRETEGAGLLAAFA